MSLRKATIQDIEQLSQLFDAYRVFYKKESDLKTAKTFLSERLTSEESVVFVTIENETELTGFVQLYPLFSSTRMKRLWMLNDLYVKPAHRGKGYSVALIDAAKKLSAETNGCGLLLETAKSNIIGNNLYPRTGFELDADHNYYSWDC